MLGFARGVIVVAMAGALLSPFSAAVAAGDPSIDPKCWQQAAQAQCSKFQGYFDEKDIEKGGSSDCGQGWFQCFSGSKPIDIAIKIGGVGQVKNLGEYIRLVYAWMIPVGAILAVVVIMIGGIMWLTSGGADRLSTAKQWIGNAIIGLCLLLFSYVILNTINPDLVRLSLPRTQILRPVVTGARFCVDLGADIVVHQSSAEGPQVSSDQYTCGKEFYPAGTTTRTCLGSICAARSVCAPGAGANGYACVPGSFAGTITTDGLAYIDKKVRLRGVCTDNETWEVLDTTAQDVTPDHKQQKFVFPVVQSTGDLGSVTCSGLNALSTDAQRRAAIKGFALEAQVEASSGAGHWFMLDRRSCGGAARARNVGGEYNPDDFEWKDVRAGELFSVSEFDQMLAGASATPCSLQITDDMFRDR